MLLNFLKKVLPYKEIGWKEIGETFYRFTLLKTRWFNIYLHWLDAPVWHPECHDHPWKFLAFIVWGGYWECAKGTLTWRGPGSLLYRPATFSHNVATMPGKPNWSFVVTSKKTRDWGFNSCDGTYLNQENTN